MRKQYLAAGNLYGDLNFLDEKDLSISNCGCVLTQASLPPLSSFDNGRTCNTSIWQQYANQEYFTNGEKITLQNQWLYQQITEITKLDWNTQTENFEK